MLPETVAAVLQELPAERRFLYYPDRESAWLLAARMPERARVAALKQGELARFLQRPLVRPVVAASGGLLLREDVRAAADVEAHALADLSRAAAAGVVAAFAVPWHDFTLSFTRWGDAAGLAWNQTTRPGANLVTQLGFPPAHGKLFGEYLPGERKRFEYEKHPIRLDGVPTLAWSRVDVCGDTALIEEVQSDWLRFAAGHLAVSSGQRPHHRATRALALYERELRTRYGRLWPNAMLLATLVVLHDLGVRTVFMHQLDAGAALKRIVGRRPPVSLYTDLPKSFGFAPTDEVPAFLRRRRKDIARIRKKAPGPMFWTLHL